MRKECESLFVTWLFIQRRMFQGGRIAIKFGQFLVFVFLSIGLHGSETNKLKEGVEIRNC